MKKFGRFTSNRDDFKFSMGNEQGIIRVSKLGMRGPVSDSNALLRDGKLEFHTASGKSSAGYKLADLEKAMEL